MDFFSFQISGFQSQGPPTSKHPVEYLRYVGLEVQYSEDGKNWFYCCDKQKMAVSLLKFTSWGTHNECRLTDDQNYKSDWSKEVFPHCETVQVSLH